MPEPQRGPVSARGAVGWLLAPDADPVARHQAVGMAFVRVVLGLMWAYNVAWKIPPDFGEEADRGLYHFTAFAVEHPVLPPYSWLVENAILPNITLFGWGVVLAETALAVMLLSGSYVRLAAVLGAGQSLAIGLSVAYAPEEWPWSYWLMIAAHVAVLVGTAGRSFGVDGVRARVHRGEGLRRAWGVLAVVVGLYSVVASFGDPLAATGPGLRSTDPSLSLGTYNLLGGLLVVLVGAGLLASSRGGRPVAVAAGLVAVVAALLTRAQLGFSDPLLGTNGTSVAVLLVLAVVALVPTRDPEPAGTAAETPPSPHRETRNP